MYVYLIETKKVRSSTFQALFYLILVLSTTLVWSSLVNNLDTVETGHIQKVVVYCDKRLDLLHYQLQQNYNYSYRLLVSCFLLTFVE